MRRLATTVSTSVAVLATLAACADDESTSGSTDPTTAPASSDASETAPSDEPIDILSIPEETALDPGRYLLPLIAGDGTTQAIVDVPEGYVAFFAQGGAVIQANHGDLAFWGAVTQVDTDPCLGGKHVDAGTSVRDLASLLVAQRNMKASRPEPVTIGGYHGLELTLTAPADLGRCRDGNVTIYTAGGDWLQWDVPDATFHQWILNVHGQRVVGGTRIAPDTREPDELNAMIESAEFTAD